MPCCVACAVSWATWLLFTGMHARCVVLHVRRPGPLGSCSLVSMLGVLCCVGGVPGHLAPVHGFARLVCCVAHAVSWVTWLLFTAVHPRCIVLRVCCPRPLGSCSPVCTLGLLCCVCGILGQLAPVHRCARSLCCVVCAVSQGTWLLFTGVHPRCVVLPVRCPCPLSSCSPVCTLGVPYCVCGVLGHLAPVHRYARSLCCIACAASWVTWLLFTGVHARCVVLCRRCPGSLGSCSPLCTLGALCCVCGVLGPLGPFHRFSRSVCCVVCAVSWASWLLFIRVHARCVVLCVRCPRRLGSCSLVGILGVLCCPCGVLVLRAPVHRCARSVCHIACAVSWATWLLFTGVRAWCVVLCVRFPGPLSSCSPLCTLRVLCCVCGVRGHLTTAHRCARSCCVCGVLGHLAPAQGCARSPCCLASAVSWGTRLLITGVQAWCVVFRVRCLGPLGSCSPVSTLGVPYFVCGVPGLLAPVHRCACSVCCAGRAVSWAAGLLFPDVHALCGALRVRCPRPVGSCSPMCTLGVLCCMCGVLGHLGPVHRCARPVWCAACAVPWATWLLFTGMHAPYVVLRVRCPWPLGSCSPVCMLGLLCCVCCILGHLAPVHRCACVFYPYLYPLLVGPPPWRAFFPACLVSLCVAWLFPWPTSSFSWSSLSCVAKDPHLYVLVSSAPSCSCGTWTWVWAVAGVVVITMRATTTMQSLTVMTILRRWRNPFGLPSACVAVLRFPHSSIPHSQRWQPTKCVCGQGGGTARLVHEQVDCPCLTCPCLLIYLVFARTCACVGTGHRAYLLLFLCLGL